MIPNLKSKAPIPETLPAELSRKIKLFAKNKNKEEFLEKSFYYVVNRNNGSRFNLLFKFNRLFITDVNILLKTKGYLHCTNMNYLLRVMLIKSGLFKEEDVVLKRTHIWYVSPHQYLEIKVSKNKKINVDPWGYQNGIDFGNYDSGFKKLNIVPIR
ncbi:MAG: hypothetical protein ACP5N2_05610 [Candidatus Nanoarchaeia archaeon]